MHQMSRTNVIVRLLLMSLNYYDFNEYFILTVTDIVHQILLILFPLFSIMYFILHTVYDSSVLRCLTVVRYRTAVVRRRTGCDWLCDIVQLSHWSPYVM